MKRILGIIFNILLLCSLAGTGYYYRDSLADFLRLTYRHYQPCDRPIAYSLGNLDEKFGLSSEELALAVSQAAQGWEAAAGKKLFEARDAGGLKVSLIYDYRQQSTDTLKKLGIAINDDKATYDSLKARYDGMSKTYEQKKVALDKAIKDYEKEKNAYEEQVAYWNGRGGAPTKEYNRLKADKAALDIKTKEINRLVAEVNTMTDDVNAFANTLNRLIKELNLNVNNYNTVGTQNGEEFQEGVYVSNSEGESITIYQFDNREMLVRVLMHELGHALGLDHLDNPAAVMYRLNEGKNAEITQDDITALKEKCGIK